MSIFLEKWAVQNGTHDHKYYPVCTEYKYVLIMTSHEVENIFLLVHPEIALLSLQAHSIDTFNTHSDEFLEPGFLWRCSKSGSV